MPLRILLADDHGVLRAGLRTLLSAQPDMEVVGEAAAGNAAVSMALQLRPDLVLTDISMPGLTGIEVAEVLHRNLPETLVLILSMHEDAGLVQEALRAGAKGYVAKRAVEADLINAIRIVWAGGTYVDAGAEKDPQSSLSGGLDVQAHAAVPLDGAEIELLRLLARGYTSAQIAAAQEIDITQLERRRAALSEKLGAHGRVDLIRYARIHRLL